MKQSGFFDCDERYAALSASVDPLAALGEFFRPTLVACPVREIHTRGQADVMRVQLFGSGDGRS
ncbi:hypothetical protein FACS1894205_4180 [Alphaproteobacteria bacterium]|nr:hypothetical protein FACS1894205_4180 [Alphaproteobacteria bacterium]